MAMKELPGILFATPGPEEAATEAALRMAHVIRLAIADRGRAAIALSGGNMPRAAYAKLAKEQGLDWSKVDIFFVDERAVPEADARSNFRQAKAALFEAAKIPPEHIFRMPADARDLSAAAKEYEATLRKHTQVPEGVIPVLDLIVLSIGDDGHTASLFPDQPEVEIADRVICAVPARNGLEARLTMTKPVIETGRTVMIMATGAAKRAPLERVCNVAGKISETPARIVHGVRGTVIWVIDRAAGGMD